MNSFSNNLESHGNVNEYVNLTTIYVLDFHSMSRPSLQAGRQFLQRRLASHLRNPRRAEHEARRRMGETANAAMSNAAPDVDYSSYNSSDLISRITQLESQLRATNEQLAACTASKTTAIPLPATGAKVKNNGKKPRPENPFDASRFETRLIALRISYLGQPYNGFEHANGNVGPKPTIEEVLWKALRKTRLISPNVDEQQGFDTTMDVVWDTDTRMQLYAPSGEEDWQAKGKKKLELIWDGCEYSKCGRTDVGVSAFGQVIGIRVRSNKKAHTSEVPADVGDDGALKHESQKSTNAFDPTADELPYLWMLNSVLPPSIRVLAWSSSLPEGFDARFSCTERRYKYFFTNPAFLPTPGPVGLTFADGRKAPHREGWLDIDAMRVAAKKLQGSHDYRNLCKIDPSKQMSSCERRISFADVSAWDNMGKELTGEKHLNATGEDGIKTLARKMGIGELVDEGPRVFCFTVHGSAFLWHQVRCMVAVLFLVGQGLEKPSVVDDLLDIKNHPQKPMYEMADDGPLVLWDCVFESPEDGGRGKIDWQYAGDEAMLPSLKTKNDAKFGISGLVETLWNQWRRAKLEETVTGSLLDMALQQGDGSALLRGGFRDVASQASQRSQKVFEGGHTARVVGKYVSMAKKRRMDTLENQNKKYRDSRIARNDPRYLPRAAADEAC
jgi:tRNA pseudouridine38/39 synthase